METTNLSKYEIAAVTLGVPCTQDPALNELIVIGARYKLAAEIIARDPNLSPTYAMAKADIFIEEFAANQNAKQKQVVPDDVK